MLVRARITHNGQHGLECDEEVLCQGFSHILNKLAAFAYQPSTMVRTLDQLLIDDRTHRQGFPFDVLIELSNLRELYARFLT